MAMFGACLLWTIAAFGQSWIGSSFNLDTSIVLQHTFQDQNLSRLKSCVHDEVFYCIEMDAFHHKESGYNAVLHALSLRDYAQADIPLPFPSTKERKEQLATKLWIYDLSFDKDFLVLSAQDLLLLYRRKNDSTFSFEAMHAHPNSKTAYLHEGYLYILEEDHDTGYKWFRRPIRGGHEEIILDLAYEAPHVVQANPNRYLFHDSTALYFLSTRFPVLHKYSLNGNHLEDINFDLPQWHPFSEDYIQKSLSVPYGVERIYATMDEIFEYSYPKVVFPLGNTYLLYYTQYDTLTGKSRPAFASIDETGRTRLHHAQDTSQAPYSDGRFPFNLFDTQEDKAHTSWNDLLLEISAEDTSDWHGRTPDEYKQAREAYFKRNDPVFKIRIMRYKNNDPASLPFFVDTDSRPLALDNLPRGKHVLLVNNELECSACVRHLLQLLNDTIADDVHIGILYPYIPGALLEREIQRNTAQHLERPFRLYYLDRKQYASYPSFMQPDSITYPALLFHETGRAPILFSLNDILDDDPYSFSFQKSFLDFWRKFNTTTPKERRP